MKMGSATVWLAGLVAWSFLAFASPSVAESLTQKPPDKVVEGARLEGKVVVYASYTYEEGDEIHAAFKKRYPFVNFEHLSLGASDPVTRALMENRANSPSADVVITGGTTALPLVKEGFVREINWASLGVPQNAIDGTYQVTVATVTYVFARNSKLVSDDAAPKNWDDLLNPKWNGKIGLWASPFAFADVAPAWGEAKVIDYVKKLMQNRPLIIREGADMANRLAAGEISVAVVIDATIRRVAEKGAPLKWSWPDPVPIVRYNANVMKNARHPNAASLYCAWLASSEGAADYEKATWRGNVYIAGSPIAQKTKGKQYSVWPTNQGDRRAALIKQLTKIQLQ